VLDTFAGSGSCGEAAFNLERDFLGFDVEQDALDYFQERKKSWQRTDGGLLVPDEKSGILEFFQ
jgi:DNA modification methylase